MGNYIAKADLLELVPLADLVALTDDNNTGSEDDTKIDGMIADAEGTVDGYLATRYDTPLATVPNIIKTITVDVAVYRLHGRRQGPPEDVVKRYEDAIRYLRDIAKGVVTLGVDTPAPDSTRNEVNIKSDDRLFGRDQMKGF
ncbi:gp436 family protein [Nitrospina gracilis]|uniref:gp436 family protein n=1 Tax=Nitrospina gracilis TaxID=35801 RepID=UPI001F268F4E|nr:DUF1320 domain-containing protein [Nitrospina gracilis]MCF8719215.1 phage gp36-like protein [Nitrospina gracilis Nb-211]